jgi:hypothetical protein
MHAPFGDADGIASGCRQGQEGSERRVEEPAQPDALAGAALPDPVHPVVPVARPDQGHPVATDGKARVEPAGAMLVETNGLRRGGRLEEAVGFL